MKVSSLGNTQELWQRKEHLKQAFLSATVAAGFTLKTTFTSEGSKITADLELYHPDEDADNLVRAKVTMDSAPANEIYEQAVSTFITRFHTVAKDHSTGLPSNLETTLYLLIKDEWDKVKNVAAPAGVKSQVIYARGEFTNVANITTNISQITSITEEALKLFADQYPDAEMNNTFDFSRDEILKETASQVQEALKLSNTPVEDLTPDEIVTALVKCEENSGLGIDEALKDILDPPPFDPFDL
jgi:hypothetical protein